MDRLGNTKLVNKKGDEVYASEVLAGKAVLFYFRYFVCVSFLCGVYDLFLTPHC